MEAANHFTCLAYDTIDFLIQSKFIIYGIYLPEACKDKNIIFESELLPHISLGEFLEKEFSCGNSEESNVMLVMKKDDFDADLQKKIAKVCQTEFPVSGNFALSVNSQVSSQIIDFSTLRLLPAGIRERMEECGISALGFLGDSHNKNRRQILLSMDKVLKIVTGGQS